MRGGGRQRGGSKEPADHALGRSRGGFGTKIHLVTDGHGFPLAVEISAGQAHESTFFLEVLDAFRLPRNPSRSRYRPDRLAADKAYSIEWIRRWLRQRRIEAVIPRRQDQRAREEEEFDRDAYRRRCVIECCIGWLKECRRVLTRFEKLAVNYLAVLKLAFIQRFLRIRFSNKA